MKLYTIMYVTCNTHFFAFTSRERKIPRLSPPMRVKYLILSTQLSLSQTSPTKKTRTCVPARMLSHQSITKTLVREPHNNDQVLLSSQYKSFHLVFSHHLCHHLCCCDHWWHCNLRWLHGHSSQSSHPQRRVCSPRPLEVRFPTKTLSPSLDLQF